MCVGSFCHPTSCFGCVWSMFGIADSPISVISYSHYNITPHTCVRDFKGDPGNPAGFRPASRWIWRCVFGGWPGVAFFIWCRFSERGSMRSSVWWGCAGTRCGGLPPLPCPAIQDGQRPRQRCLLAECGGIHVLHLASQLDDHGLLHGQHRRALAEPPGSGDQPGFHHGFDSVDGGDHSDHIAVSPISVQSPNN